MKVNLDQAYLLGLLVGGGVVHKNSLQIVLPYKKWGEIAVNPARGGQIAKDILQRLNPLFSNSYGMDVSYKVGTDWKIVSEDITESFKLALSAYGLPKAGELRSSANLQVLRPLLTSLEHKKRFITGLVDTIGSLATSHRRFVSTFQVISFEFKGSNFELVRDVAKILIDMNCLPDQILWNHPNQHSGTDRYYRSWKKGFKIRVSLDDYMLKGGFVFSSKKLSAEKNKTLQNSKKANSTEDKAIRVGGRSALHIDENNEWLPSKVRGGHYIHNLHFYALMGLPTPEGFDLQHYLNNFHHYFCPFTCLTKGSSEEIKEIIASEPYLTATTYKTSILTCQQLKDAAEKSSGLVFGKTKEDGFPRSNILQAVAFIIASNGVAGKTKGKRVLGSYEAIINTEPNFQISIGLPNKGTCLLLQAGNYAALIGYVNNDFNKTLIVKKEKAKVYLREPVFKECVQL
ncbi:MAG: hypothetical protein MK052_03975 [Alphaproteobacteria bacterium]|nr:hypothetical protein [Alphaproteobacteria bacterium]